MSRKLRLSIAVSVALLASTVRAEDGAPGKWNPGAAATYLDERAAWWLGWSSALRGQGTVCISCHTGMAVALGRPALNQKLRKSADKLEIQLIENVRRRVQSWGTICSTGDGKDPLVPFYGGKRKPSALGSEAVMNALVLVNHDRRRANGNLSGPARKALEYMWEQQQANGAWLWLDFGLQPWEKDAYYGTTLAALAVGTAGESYYGKEAPQAKFDALKKYLNAGFRAQPFHHQLFAIWASSRLPELLDRKAQKDAIAAILMVQEKDGGWRLPRLGQRATGTNDWQSHGAYPPGATSDGYATGLAVLALKSAGLTPDHPSLKNGLAWLVENQKDGTWPVNYPNRPRDAQSDVGKFMRDAATAFAVLALTSPYGKAD